MLARQQGLTLSWDSAAARKLGRDRALEQTVVVLGEAGGLPHRVLDAEIDEPAKQQIGVDPLDRLPLRAAKG